MRECRVAGTKGPQHLVSIRRFVEVSPVISVPSQTSRSRVRFIIRARSLQRQDPSRRVRLIPCRVARRIGTSTTDLGLLA